MFPTLRAPIVPHVSFPLSFPTDSYRLIAVGDVHGCLEELLCLLSIVKFPVPPSIAVIPPNIELKLKAESTFPTISQSLSYSIHGESIIDTSWLKIESDSKACTEESNQSKDSAISTILIVLGDLVNKGPFSAEVIQFLRRLQEYYDVANAIESNDHKYYVFCIRGNHDEAAIKWATETEKEIPEKYDYVYKLDRYAFPHSSVGKERTSSSILPQSRCGVVSRVALHHHHSKAPRSLSACGSAAGPSPRATALPRPLLPARRAVSRRSRLARCSTWN